MLSRSAQSTLKICRVRAQDLPHQYTKPNHVCAPCFLHPRASSNTVTYLQRKSSNTVTYLQRKSSNTVTYLQL